MSDDAGSGPPTPRSGPAGRAAAVAAPAKGPAAFRTISEASAELGVPQHVLRFWETRFAFISPTKRAGGRRFYRPQDLDVLRGVRSLLQDEGYTIKGVQKLHREGGLKRLLAAAGGAELAPPRPADAPSPAPPALSAAPVSVAGDDGEEEGPGTLDLFADAPAPAPRRTPTPSPAVAAKPAIAAAPAPALSQPAGRPVLDAGARARLADVLDDLQTTKAEIDALLQGD